MKHVLAKVHWHRAEEFVDAHWCLECLCGKRQWAGQSSEPSPIVAWQIYERHLALVNTESLERIASALEELARIP